MATGADPTSTDRTTSLKARLFRLTSRQCQAMASAGIFDNDKHVELLGGILVRKMSKNPPHNFALSVLNRLLSGLLVPHWVVWSETSVELARRWLPEPDIAVLVGPDRRYEAVLATAADVAMIVEVANASYAEDRGLKWRKYAAAGIPTYWIVNLARRQVEVYRQPDGAGADAAYQQIDVFGESTAVPVVVGGEEVGRIDVADILPSAPRAEG